MKNIRKNIFIWTILGFFGFSTLGCGYILYPERRNAHARGGQIDAAVLVMDLLWLIPGILPGVIALVWDGIHGSWYISGSKASVFGQTPQRVPHITALRPIEIRSAATLTGLRLQDSSGRMHELPTVSLSSDRKTATLPAQVSKGPASLLVANGKQTCSLPVIVD